MAITKEWLKIGVIIGALILMSGSLIMGKLTLAILTVVGLIGLYLLVKYPQVTFLLFLFAGTFKGDSRLDFLPSYIDLTILFLGLTWMGIILFIWNNRDMTLINKNFLYSYLTLGFFMTITLLYTPSPSYGLDKVLRFWTITAGAAFTPIFLFRKKTDYKQFFWALLGLVSVMIAESFANDFARQVFGANYIAFGRVSGMAVLVIFYYFLQSGIGIRNSLFYWTLLPITAFSLLNTAARGPVVAVALSIAFITMYAMYVYQRRKEEVRGILNKGILLALGGGALFIAFYDRFAIIIRRMMMIFTQPSGGASVATRLKFYQEAIRGFSQNILTGLGVGGFSYLSEGSDFRWYPHNLFLEMFSELGVLGGLIILWLIGSTFYLMIRLLKNADQKNYHLYIITLSVLIFTFFNAMVSGDINDNRIFFCSIGLVYALEIFQQSSLKSNGVKSNESINN